MDGNESRNPFVANKKLDRSPKSGRLKINTAEAGGEGATDNSMEVLPSPNNYYSPVGDVTGPGLPQRQPALRSSQKAVTPTDRKRKCTDDNHPISPSNYRQISEENSKIVAKLQEYILTTQAKLISKQGADVIMQAVRDLENNCNALIIENAELKGELEARKSCQPATKLTEPTIQQMKNLIENTVKEQIKSALEVTDVGASKVSYARALALFPTTPKKQPSSVFIAPTEQSKAEYPTIEDLKQGIKRNFTPASEGVKIRGIIQTTKGIVIRTQTKDEAKKVLESAAIKRMGAQVRLEEKRLPRIIIYDVPYEIEEAKLSELFWKVNASNLDRGKQIFKPIFKTGPRGKDTVHWVAEVSPAVREEILAEGRVFLDWASCNARDWLAVTRCNKCQGYGHAEKFCSAKSKNCAYCGERGHDIGDCPTQKASGPAKCINCTRTNLSPADHTATHKDCPSYKRALDRLAARTQYTEDG